MNPGSDSVTTDFQDLRPQSVRELAHALEMACRHDRSSDSRRATSVPSCLQDALGALNQVVDYPARDMTITVQAGVTVATLRQILTAESQQLPIDVSNQDTPIGRLVAEDIRGPRQYGYGTLRDYVIGLEAVDGTGRVFHAGGRVVKNVAGYDLCRLLIGSRGCYGIITQITFKLKPRPRCQELMSAVFSDWSQLKAALETLNLSDARPVVLDVWNHLGRITNTAAGALFGQHMATGTAESPLLVIAVDGTESACKWQMDRLKEELKPRTAEIATHGGKDAFSDYCELATLQTSVAQSAHSVMRLNVPRSRVSFVCESLTRNGVPVFGRAGNGELFLTTQNDSTAESSTSRCVEWLTANILNDGDSRLSSLQGPESSNDTIPEGERNVMKQLKQALDPCNLLPDV
jgi:glycolate dehydrogenase FAD-binding subunit